ncbi:MAG: BamA/TamA family outer membrane protein [Deltaproteobacteria bacterium]|nr:BamA/TamA family outer membrane protein [Deltaproteobacteria bacterium]
MQRIGAFLQARGYFSAQVKPPRIAVDSDGGVSIDVAVASGRPTRIQQLKIAGSKRLPASVARRLAAATGLRTGDVLIYPHYSSAKTALLRELRASGYPYAAVTGRIAVNRGSDSANVQLTVDSGPRVVLGAIRLRGNGPLPADKLRALITFRSGDLFDERQFARTRARFFRQQVFSSVHIALPDQPQAHPDVMIDLEPAKLRVLRLGAGIGVERRRHELRATGSWTIYNFLGGLRVLNVELKPALVAMPAVWDRQRNGPAITSSISLKQPDLLATGLTAYVRASYELGIHEGYRFHGPGLQPGLERTFFDERLRVGLSWNLQFFDFFDVDLKAFEATTTQLGLGFVDPYRLAWIEPFAQLDLRDSILDPRAGFFAELRFELGHPAIAGDFSYIKMLPEVRGYVPLGTKRLVLALRVQLGYLRPSTGIASPVTRRLSLGGPTRHRGFSYGRLSPQAKLSDGRRVPLGGHGALLFSADLRLRLVQLFGYWIGLGAFLDGGDVTANFSDLALDNLHLATGAGLLYATPIGTLRLALGVRLNRLAEQSSGRANPDPGERLTFHLTVGTAF